MKLEIDFTNKIIKICETTDLVDFLRFIEKINLDDLDSYKVMGSEPPIQVYSRPYLQNRRSTYGSGIDLTGII